MKCFTFVFQSTHLIKNRVFIFLFLAVLPGIATSAISQIAQGGQVTLMLQDDGSLWRYDRYKFGSISGVPNYILDKSKNWKQVFSGHKYVYAIDEDGLITTINLWKQGEVAVDTKRNWIALTEILSPNHDDFMTARDYARGLGLDDAGKLWAWETGFSNPMTEEISSEFKWIAVSSNILIRDDNTLWKIIDNAYLPIKGVGFSFEQIGEENDWVKISSSSRHSLAIKKMAVYGRGAGMNVSSLEMV